MLARVVWKLVMALSVALAVALAALWVRTRGVGRDLVVSGGRGGTYREVRVGGGRVGVTLVPGWPANERFRAGRPVSRNSAKDTYVPSKLFPALGQLALLDGSRLTLNPTTPPSWLAWPPARSSGTAYVEGAIEKHLKFSGGFTSTASKTGGAGTLTGVFVPSTAPASGVAGANPANATTAPSTALRPTTLNFRDSTFVTVTPPTSSPAGAATMPTLVVGGQVGVATATANAVTAGLKNATNLTFRTAPVPTTTPMFISGNAISFTNVYLVPTYTFERYAMPLWPLVAVVLLPVWVALAAAFVHATRRGIRRRKGRCESCGYDLRGSPAGGACPECGAATSGGPVAPTGDVLLARLR